MVALSPQTPLLPQVSGGKILRTNNLNGYESLRTSEASPRLHDISDQQHVTYASVLFHSREVDYDSPRRIPWHRSAFEQVKSGFKRNAGLFLVTGSQAFVALMNVSVKKLNSLDPPVPPLEVCSTFCTFFCPLKDVSVVVGGIAHCDPHGMYFTSFGYLLLLIFMFL